MKASGKCGIDEFGMHPPHVNRKDVAFAESLNCMDSVALVTFIFIICGYIPPFFIGKKHLKAPPKLPIPDSQGGATGGRDRNF